MAPFLFEHWVAWNALQQWDLSSEAPGVRQDSSHPDHPKIKKNNLFTYFLRFAYFKMHDNLISLFLFVLLFLFLSLVTSNFCWTFPPNNLLPMGLEYLAHFPHSLDTLAHNSRNVWLQVSWCQVLPAASDWLRVSALDSDWLMMGWWGMSRACHDRVNVTRTWNLRAWCLGTPGMQASDIASPRTTSRLSNLYHIIWKCFRE